MNDRFRQWFPGQCFAVAKSLRRRCMNHALSGADLCQLHTTHEQAGRAVERVPSSPTLPREVAELVETPQIVYPTTDETGGAQVVLRNDSGKPAEFSGAFYGVQIGPPEPEPPILVVRGFRIFRRQDSLPGTGELGAAVWFCSDETVDTFGVVVVGRAAAEHFKVGDRFKLVPDYDPPTEQKKNERRRAKND